jgi:hypothetical protein
MLRKTLIALTTIAALGVGSTAMAMHGGGHGGMGAMHGGWGGRGMAPMHTGWGGHHFVGRPFARNAFFHHRFHRFHRRNVFFVGAGFAGGSCWIWTHWGWRNVCGYPYWAY